MNIGYTTQEQAPPTSAPPTSTGDGPVEQVVCQLRGMGFDDDGGWLTELVKAKGADIEKVLDALHPSTSGDQ